MSKLKILFLCLMVPFFLLGAKRTKFASANYSPLSFQSAKPIIVIDPGHGGVDLGTKRRAPYCEEKRIALRCALLTRKYLDQLGYKVLMTRSSDVFLPLWRRVQLANKRHSSLFVSIHFNASKNSTAHGIEVYYCNRPKRRTCSKASKRLATKVIGQVIQRTRARSRGVKNGNFYVIRETKIPAILVEGGFISNKNERIKLRQTRYLDKIARGIANGIDRYFKS